MIVTETGIVGAWVQRPTAGADGAPQESGVDVGQVVHVAFPGPGASLCLLVARDVTGYLEWWDLAPVRPVALLEPPEGEEVEA